MAYRCKEEEPEAVEFKHLPIMLSEVLDGLDIKSDGIYVDGTLGGAGHSGEIVKRLDKGRLIGIDQDADAIKAATGRIGSLPQVTIVKDNYRNIPVILKHLNIDSVDGVLLDLGVSSYQLDNKERGFSYREDARLDMRMDKDSDYTAEDIVNDYSEDELIRILRMYGEESYAVSIARNIVKERQDKRIETTFRLNNIIKSSIPAKAKRDKNPCKKTYQAIRIELNKELTVLEETLDEVIDILAPGGRFAVITFHSLEDRMVKIAFRDAENPCICPPQFPICTCGRVPKGKVVTRKPIVASEKELQTNPRASSAKLRIFEKI